MQPTHCFAVPGSDSMIDMVHPVTGLSWCFGKTLDEVRQEYPGAELMAFDDWRSAKAERQNVPFQWEPTTQQFYEDMLEVLPPAAYASGNYPSGFLVGEPSDHEALTGHPRFQAFRIINGCYFVASRPMTIAEFLGKVVGKENP